MADIVNINDNVYTISEVITDLELGKDNIQDIVFVTLLKDGTSMVSHTGLPLHHMALACKLMDREFNNLIDLTLEDEE